MQQIFQVLLLAALGLTTADVAHPTLSLRGPGALRQAIVEPAPRRKLQNYSNGSYGYGNESPWMPGDSFGTTPPPGFGYGDWSNFSNGSYGYGNGNMTPMPPGFGNGSYVECPEMYCWENIYTASGEPDFEKTYMQAHTCASYTEGCPCNDQWEIECEEFGMKYCYPRSDGCYDPFAVTCNNDTEFLCKNEWSSYCQDKSWGPCPISCSSNQTYCSSYIYDSEGNVNWTAPMRESCSDTTCPCDSQWEDKCVDTVYNYSWCTPKAYPCPITCAMDEQVCYHMAYTANGEPDYDLPGSSSCAPMNGSCPCDSQWEDKCVDTVYNYSYCTPKAYPCPITCAMDEQYCYQVAYLSTGEPDWSLPTNMSCAPMNGSCPCHPVWEELCNSSWGSYCQPKHHGACPIVCKDDEHYCYTLPYDEFGNQNYSAPWQESCATATIGCPCDATWEHKCTADYGYGGFSWCQSKSDPCPVDCGNRSMCWHHSGNQSCATTSGCVCEADETACPDTAGKMTCYWKQYLIDWYGDAEKCPVTCNWDTQLLCNTEGFDASGGLTWTEYCYTITGASDDWSNWWCPVVCNNDTAKKCAWTDEYSECVALTDSCPEVCTSERKTCWVENYDTSGNYLNGSDTCAPKNANCPCGENTQRCTFDGYSYCQSTFYGACPVICAADEKNCYPMSFTPEGVFDWNAPARESCVKLNATCPCGANAKMCKWTNDWGDKEEVCFAEVESCPESCAAGERRCYLTDYNASGYPAKYSERCVAEGQSCPCGTNSQECLDPAFGESFCYPVVDFWLNEPMKCPVFCSEQQDYCYIPSFDAKGEWLRTTEECVPKGQACDCSKGTNAFSCTWKDELWGSWTECLPTHNGYCPADCPEGEVACDLVEDFLPNGTALGLSQPSVKCAASLDKCPCGKESTRCPRQGCVFKDEGCAAECGPNQKKCYIADYKEDGSFISDQEICVGSEEICKCGKNTAKCANSDLCLPLADKQLICPCKASEKSCPVTDFDKDGTITGFSTQCVKEGNPCPCGKNSISCADPNDALLKLCVPSFAHKRCPAPCTVDALNAGNKTCVQNNLDSKGDFKSTTIQCLGANETCGVGEGMKRCASGAAIAVDTACVNLYAYAAFADSVNRGGRRMEVVQTAQRQTCNAIITMSSVRSDAKSKAETVRVKMNSVLQIPNTLTTSLAIKQSSTSRRLHTFDARQLSGSTSTMVFTIDNQGVSGSVTPEQVCEQLKKMVKSSNPSLQKAVSAVGVMNSQAGVNMELSTTALKSRSQIQGTTATTTTSTTSTTSTSASGTSAGESTSDEAGVSTTTTTVTNTLGMSGSSAVVPGRFLFLAAMVVALLR